MLSAEHLKTLSSRANLAYMRGNAGDPAGAVAACEAVLADRIRVFGATTPTRWLHAVTSPSGKAGQITWRQTEMNRSGEGADAAVLCGA
jgi:hypothetical protein